MPHTPGPWSVEESRDGLHRIKGPNGETVAVCREQNLPILAAAPRLLESAKRFLDTSCNCEKDYTCEMCELRAAIAAAEGDGQ